MLFIVVCCFGVLVFCVGSLPPVIRCYLFVGCRWWFVVLCSLFVVWWLLVVRCSLFVGCLSLAVCCLLLLLIIVTCCVLPLFERCAFLVACFMFLVVLCLLRDDCCVLFGVLGFVLGCLLFVAC